MDIKRREVSVDQALVHVGEFGHFQRVQTAVCALTWAVTALQTALVLLSTLGATDPQASRLLECSKTGGEACEAALSQPYPALCTLPSDSWQWSVSTGFSIVTEFDLVCNRAWLAPLPAVAFFAGSLIGCMACHLAAERVGRRRLLSAGLILTGVAGIMAATAPFLWSLCAFRAAAGAGVATVAIASFLLSADILGPSWRPFAGVFLHGGFSLGAATGALIAWTVPGWRLATLFGALCPLLVTILVTTSLIVESPEWLLLNGRKGEATAALASVAFANRTRPLQHPLADPTALLGNPHRNAVDVLRSPRLRRRASLLGAVWLATSMAYYASALLVDALGSGDPGGDGSALEIALAGFAYEIPGVAAAALAAERLGRRRTVVAGLAAAAAALGGAGFSGPGALQRGLAAGARFGLAAASASLLVLSWEAFPVVVQRPGMAIVNYAARFGAVIAPIIAFSAGPLGSPALPLLVSGTACAAGTMAAFALPETLGAPVYDTIQEYNAAAQIKRHRHSWWAHSPRVAVIRQHAPGGGPGSSSLASVSTAPAAGPSTAV
jgi:MFS transporter, OCT family, solute carrier family 22 (organic cation transporter), member 4/5